VSFPVVATCHVEPVPTRISWRRLTDSPRIVTARARTQYARFPVSVGSGTVTSAPVLVAETATGLLVDPSLGESP
jgi:hypothetical protein